MHGASSGLHGCAYEPVVREAVHRGEQAEWVCRLTCEGISMQGASPGLPGGAYAPAVREANAMPPLSFRCAVKVMPTPDGFGKAASSYNISGGLLREMLDLFYVHRMEGDMVRGRGMARELAT